MSLLKNIYHFLHPAFKTLFLEYNVDFKPRYGHGQPPHHKLYEIIDAHRETYADTLRLMLQYRDNLHTIKQ